MFCDGLWYDKGMKEIVSTKNEYIKTLRGLKQKKNRQQEGKFLAEGVKNVEEALRHARVEAVLVTNAVSEVATNAQALGIDVVLVNEAVMQAVCDVKTPQEALAVVALEEQAPKEHGTVVLLEDVADPGNVGTIIRTASAIGAAGVILAGDCADHTSPKVVRSSMGSIFQVPIRTVSSVEEAILPLKEKGYSLLAGHLQGKSAMPSTEDVCLVIGNEARGVSPQAEALCDYLVKINMYGEAESLNAAVAAGILLYRIKEGC